MSYCPNYRYKEIPRKVFGSNSFDEKPPIIFHECACSKQTSITGGSQCAFLNREQECPQNPDCME
jgi:hypothetical protein